MNKNKNLAFTLAEVLIVIGIIGVVAALTLPNLNHATGDKEKVTKVKKIYSALTEAVDRAQAIYGPLDTWCGSGCGSSECFAKRVTEFLKVSKDCGFESGCFADTPFVLVNGREYTDSYLSDLISSQHYMVTLADGMSVAFQNASPLYRIRVDIDGPNKGRNQEGNDLFDFTIVDENLGGEALINQVYPSISPESWTGNFDNVTSYATAWVIENGNLDYLKATYDGGYKCSDGEVLNWETKTSCQ